jgi:hypothetical protein
MRRLLLLPVLVLVLAACDRGGSGADQVVTPPDGVVPTAPPDAGAPGTETEDGGATGDEPDAASTVDPIEGDADGDARSTEVGAWERREDAPVALTEVAAAPFGGALWTAGGLDVDGRAVALVQVHDPTFGGWADGPALPRALHHTALVATGDGLALVGGYEGSGFDAPTAAVSLLDPETGGWVDGPALPEPRAAGAAAFDGTRIVYGGGVGPDGLRGDVWALEDGAWRSLGTLSEPREHLAGASDGEGRVWFLGGRTGGFDTNLATVDVVEGDAVRRTADLPTPRGGLSGLHLPGIGACALGGEGTQGTFAEVECVDADGAVRVLPPLATPRHGLGAAVVEGTAYTALGGPEPGLFVSPVLEVLVR